MILFAAIFAVLGTLAMLIGSWPGADDRFFRFGAVLVGLAVCLLALPGVSTR